MKPSSNPHRLPKFLTSFFSLQPRMTQAYVQGLSYCLQHPYRTIFMSMIFFMISLLLSFSIPYELIPAQDQSLLLFHLKTPVGSSIEYTDRIVQTAENHLRQKNEVQHVYAMIGSDQDLSMVNHASIYVMLKDASLRNENQRTLMKNFKTSLTALLPEATMSAQDLSLTGFSPTRGYPMEWTLQGKNWNTLKAHAQWIQETLNQQGLLEDIQMDYEDQMPQIHITTDRTRLASYGLSSLSLSQQIGSLVGGALLPADTQYPIDGHRYPIEIQAEKKQFSKVEDLHGILMSNNRAAQGEWMPLKKMAHFESPSGLAWISRVHRQRAITFYANLAEGVSQSKAVKALKQLQTQLTQKDPAYSITMMGNTEVFEEAFQGLWFALLLGIIVAYMVLASQFNSFIQPLSILMSLPFSLSGALLSLVCFHQSLNIFSMMGLVLLMGIVKKNSILLVDFTNQKRALGLPVQEALLAACPIRLRPILMTSMATVAAALPEAIAIGTASETRMPMAIVLIGGVLMSCVFTLMVVPCVYQVFASLEPSYVVTRSETV